MTTSKKMNTLEYDLGADVRAFTTTHEMDARRTNPLPLSQISGLPIERIVIPHQVHDTCCMHITQAFLDLPQEQRMARLEGIDALISNVPDTLLCISTADCIPIIIYDVHHHAAASIHAGWKGTVQRIAEKTFSQMQQTFGTQGEDCLAIIGPGISLAMVNESHDNTWSDVQPPPRSHLCPGNCFLSLLFPYLPSSLSFTTNPQIHPLIV